MIPAKSVLDLTNGEPLTPARLNRAFWQMYSDLGAAMKRRYSRSSFELDFSGLTEASTSAEQIFLLKPPFGWRIEAVELYLYAATGNIVDVSIESDMPGFETVVVEPAGATTRAVATQSMNAIGSGGTQYTFTLRINASGAYTLTRCRVMIHFRSDRGNAAVAYTPVTVADAPTFASAESNVASKLNTAFTAYATSLAQLTNSSTQNNLRINVFALRNIPAALPASDRDIRLPFYLSQRFHSMDVVNLGAVGDNITGALLPANRGAAITSVTVNGSGTPPAKTQGTLISHSMTGVGIPSVTDPADDYFIQMTRAGGGTIPLAYVVVYTC